MDGSTKELSGTLNLSDDLLSFIPDENLSQSELYRVELNTTTLKDFASNPYSGNPIETIIFKIKDENGNYENSGYYEGAGYEEGITPIETYSSDANIILGAQANCLDSIGNIIYIGTDKGLDILIYDPETALTLLSHLESTELGSVYSIKIHDNQHQEKRIYVGSSTGFTILDHNLTNPHILAHYQTRNANNVEIPVYGIDTYYESNSATLHAYLAATTLGVIDLNITTETTPQMIQSTNNISTAFDVYRSHDYECEGECEDEIIVSNFTNDLLFLTLDLNIDYRAGITGHVRNSFENGWDIYISAGVEGLVSSYGEEYYATASYNTKIVDAADLSIALIRDIGIGFFNSIQYEEEYYSSPEIYRYLKTSFAVTLMGYIEETGTDNRILLMSDKNGNIYLYEIPYS